MKESTYWIDVYDRLPQNFEAVLVFADFVGKSYMAEVYTVGCYQIDHWTTDRDQDSDIDYITVKYWMPIIDPPTS